MDANLIKDHTWWRRESDKQIIYEIKNAKSINIQDKYGSCPLSLASHFGKSYEIIKTLLECGADVNELDAEGDSPLFNFIIRGGDSHYDTIKILIEHGADVNHIGGNCMSVLMVACGCSSERVIRFLLDNGADIRNDCIDEHDLINKLAVNINISKGFKDYMGMLMMVRD